MNLTNSIVHLVTLVLVVAIDQHHPETRHQRPILVLEGSEGGRQTKSRIDGKMKAFKTQNKIRNEANITLQSISPNNTLIFQNVEYSLDGLKPYSVLSSQYDNESPVNSPILEKVVNGTHITVVMDANKISHICFQNEMGRADLIPVQNNMTVTIPVYAVINQEDYDEQIFINSMKSFDNENIFQAKKNGYGKTVQPGDNVAGAKTIDCRSHRVIEVAIAHDASLCEEFGGSKSRTDAHIQAVVGLATAYYAPSCIKLELSHIDGTCDSKNDAYKDIAKSKQILEEFTSEWRSKKASVRRDVAHLFSGSSFDSGVLGWAWKSTLCKKNNAYGANWISWSENIALRASLFAHELAHNAGASHLGKDCSNWLMAPCGSGLQGFAEESQRAVISYISKQSCLHNEVIIPTATPSPVTEEVFTTNTLRPTGILLGTLGQQSIQYTALSSAFELRSKVLTSHCLAFENNSVVLSECNKSSSQQWAFDQNEKHIINVANGRCLVPSTEDQRLAVRSCPRMPVKDTSFEWKFSNKNIRSKKEDIFGDILVIEATVAIKIVNGVESVIVIPTVSKFDGNKADYQKWIRNH